MSTPTSALPDPHAYEERVRRGDLGPQWQTMQRRIDAGETSLEALFTGKDESPLAQAMLATSRKRLTEMAQTPEAERPASFTEALAELTATRAQVEGMQGTAGEPS
jgi:hypothetical protein